MSGSRDVLSAVFVEYSDRLVRDIAYRLDRLDWHLAEDLSQEVFVRLVRDYGHRPEQIDTARVFGLLKTIGAHAIADHYRLRRSTETPVDTTDWWEANRLPVDHSAEAYAIADLTARAMLADSPAPLGVAA